MLAQEQPLIQRVRNGSLVERLCAEEFVGLNGFGSESLEAACFHAGWGALQHAVKQMAASGSGVYRSENAGMSGRQLR